MNIKESSFPKYINEPEYYKNKQFVFLDISGFTPLCDKFISESSYGAEKIGDLINIVFNPIIDSVYAAGGDVISFAGDALFVAVDKDKVSTVQKMSDRIIKEQTIDRNLSIKIEMFDKPYVPFVINSDNSSCFSYAPHNLKKEIFKNDPFPQEIYDIYKSSFRGELRAVPIFFIHIDEKHSVEEIKHLLSELAEEAKKGSIYINKIEYLDKGWMILLSAGSPVYSTDAPVKIYELLSRFTKKAETMKIPVQIGGTLQRGYCGIIGNEKRWEFTFLGSNVNLAARIAAKAESYKICADSSFAAASKTMLKSISFGKREFKGVGEREVFEIIGVIKDQKNLFIGRVEETKNALDFFKGDRRAFVLINGPSGMGKTVLAEHIVQALGYKNLIRFKGVYGEDTDNYLFRSLSDAQKSSAADIFQKFKAIFEPTLIYIDDLHFADEKSLFIFHRMINEGNPFVNFIATTIGREKIRISPLSYYESMVIDLKPFDAKDIQLITRMVSGLSISLKASRELQKTTKGNPLFVTGILPYITKDIERSGEVPYSLQEVILMKLQAIPGKGPEFVDGGSVYGDVFDHGVLKDVVKIKEEVFRDIIFKAENEGLVRMSSVKDEIEFSNTIIREIIYERLLKKKIDFFRIRIAEAIIRSKTKDFKRLYKAFLMLFLAGDERTLDLGYKLVKKYKNTRDQDTLRNILQKCFEFIKSKNNYSRAYDFIELFSESSGIKIGAGMTKIVEEISLKITDWENNERLLLHLAKVIFYTEYKEPKEILEKYREKKGEDKYYKWYKAITCAYSTKQSDALNLLNDIKNSFESNDKAEFYIDFVWYAFFIIGNTDMEKEGMKILQQMEPKLPDHLRMNLLTLKNTLANHRDDMETSKHLLDEMMKIRTEDPEKLFTILNDYAIVYSNMAYQDLNCSFMKKSLKYSERAVKLLKDYQKIAELPLISTNLASFYMTAGYVKKSLRTYLEGLYYGMNIAHPVEVPYTKSRMVFVTSASGSYKLALDLCEDIIKKPITDLLAGMHTARYLYGGRDPNDLVEAEKKAKKFLKFGTSKCYMEMGGLLAHQAIVENDAKTMKKMRDIFSGWHKFPQRPGMRFSNEANIEILGVLTGVRSDVPKLEKRLSDLEKLQINFGLISKAYYALGKHYKDVQMLKTAEKYALKMILYPFVQRIEKELYAITGDKYWAQSIKKSDRKLEQINKISTVEEFFGKKL
jgi:class 3 adenylate cyclase